MKINRLKLNTDKTQFIWMGSRQQLAKVDGDFIQLDNSVIQLTTQAKNLGVTLDARMTMAAHVNNISQSCFYQLRQLQSVRRSLTIESSKTLVHSFVSSRVDYCNSIFYGTSDVVLRKLQAILNAAARLVACKK